MNNIAKPLPDWDLDSIEESCRLVPTASMNTVTCDGCGRMADYHTGRTVDAIELDPKIVLSMIQEIRHHRRNNDS